MPPRGDISRNEPDPIGSNDAIILGDVGPTDVSSELWARLEAFVAERGDAVFSIGPRNWASLGRQETARKLLPVMEPRLVEIDATAAQADQAALPPGEVVRPLTNGLERDSWPMLQLDLDAEKNGEIWAGLPRIPWLVAGRAKPGATVLAVAGGDDSAAVIAHSPRGSGKFCGWAPTGPGTGGSGRAIVSIIGSGGKWRAGRPPERWRRAMQTCGSGPTSLVTERGMA